MTDTPNRPPLWREIDKAWWSLVDTADPHPLPPESDQAACVIRAVRDWLVPETDPCPDMAIEATGSTASDMQTIAIGTAAEIRALRDWLLPEPEEPGFTATDEEFAIWEERKALRALLTAEADRAERGDDN